MVHLSRCLVVVIARRCFRYLRLQLLQDLSGLGQLAPDLRSPWHSEIMILVSYHLTILTRYFTFNFSTFWLLDHTF